MHFFGISCLVPLLGLSLVSADITPELLALAKDGLGSVPSLITTQLQKVGGSQGKTSGTKNCQLGVSSTESYCLRASLTITVYRFVHHTATRLYCCRQV